MDDRSVLNRPGHQTISPADYREAMSRFAGAVSIATTDGPAGKRGVTVSAAVSVSDNPPTLLVCLNRNREENRLFEQNGTLALNTLCADQVELARAFAGIGHLSMDERFALGEWANGSTGAPLLNGARMALDCMVTDVQAVHTHWVIMAQVVGCGNFREAPTLVYLDRAYRSL